MRLGEARRGAPQEPLSNIRPLMPFLGSQVTEEVAAEEQPGRHVGRSSSKTAAEEE